MIRWRKIIKKNCEIVSPQKVKVILSKVIYFSLPGMSYFLFSFNSSSVWSQICFWSRSLSTDIYVILKGKTSAFFLQKTAWQNHLVYLLKYEDFLFKRCTQVYMTISLCISNILLFCIHRFFKEVLKLYIRYKSSFRRKRDLQISSSSRHSWLFSLKFMWT